MLINLGIIWFTAQIFPAFAITGGLKGLVLGAAAFMLVNIALVPLMKVLLLPLNLLTLGLFTWLSNILALYLLITKIPSFKISAYSLSGMDINGFTVPAMTLNPFHTAIVTSFIIGVLIHLAYWLFK